MPLGWWLINGSLWRRVAGVYDDDDDDDEEEEELQIAQNCTDSLSLPVDENHI